MPIAAMRRNTVRIACAGSTTWGQLPLAHSSSLSGWPLSGWLQGLVTADSSSLSRWLQGLVTADGVRHSAHLTKRSLPVQLIDHGLQQSPFLASSEAQTRGRILSSAETLAWRRKHALARHHSPTIRLHRAIPGLASRSFLTVSQSTGARVVRDHGLHGPSLLSGVPYERESLGMRRRHGSSQSSPGSCTQPAFGPVAVAASGEHRAGHGAHGLQPNAVIGRLPTMRGLRSTAESYLTAVNTMFDQKLPDFRPVWYTEEFQQALGSARAVFEEKLLGAARRVHGEEAANASMHATLINLLLLRRWHFEQLEAAGGLAALGEPQPLDEPFLGDTHAYAQCANAVYCPDVLTSHLPVRHVVAAELSGVELKYPRFAVVVDHTRQAVVLAVRGTASIADAVTNALCNDVELFDGVAHAGFLAGARALIDVAHTPLAEALRKYPGYSCVLTGHSLGGGIAILAGLLMHTERQTVPSDRRLQVWAFAPGTAFSSVSAFPQDDTASGGGPFCVHSFVHHADVVPRLSLRSLFRLYSALLAVHKLPLSSTERHQLVRAHEPLPTNVFNMLRDCVDSAKAAAAEEAFANMQLPGRPYLLTPRDEARTRYALRRLKPDALSEPLPYTADCCISDHTLSNYMRALERIEGDDGKGHSEHLQ